MGKEMIEINKIYCEDCLETMKKLGGVSCILTSPPYNTSRKGATDLSTHQCRYEDYNDIIDVDGSPIFNYGRFIDDFKNYMKGE